MLSHLAPLLFPTSVVKEEVPDNDQDNGTEKELTERSNEEPETV